MSIVASEHRPTLGDILAPRVGRRGVRVLAALAALVAVIVAIASRGSAGEDAGLIAQSGPVPFTLRSFERLERIAPQDDEILRLEGRRGLLFVQSFVVAPLALEPYRGDVVGALPLEGARAIEALRSEYDEFELVQDGKARVNERPAYAILFRARLGERRLYGREVILPEPEAGSRRGVRLSLLATPAGGVSEAGDVGVRGAIKRPFRTFRFGAERP